MTGYPWTQGDPLYANDLNAAIANAGAVSNANTFNVLDHGVKMDGVTDDYVALNALVSTAGATPGSVVYFPPSPTSLLLSQAVHIYPGQMWWAYPGSVTIAPTAGNVASIMLWVAETVSNASIHGLVFDGGGQDFANANPVSTAYRVNGLVLDQVTYQNTRGIAFNGSGNNDLIVRGCTWRNIGNHWRTTGNRLDRWQALCNTNGDLITWGFRTRIEDCLFYDVGLDCVNLQAIQDVQIVNNVFRQPAWQSDTLVSPDYPAAMYPYNCMDVLITGNVIDKMSGNGIDAPAVLKLVISGNTIRNSSGSGIGLFNNNDPTPGGCDYVTITGNMITDNGGGVGDGITINHTGVAAKNIRIANNVITDTRTSGKTQDWAVSRVGTTPSSVWVDPSNFMVGNVDGAVNGLSPAAVTGAKDGNTALASLLTTLAGFGLITDSTT